jgi:uncharacterized protein YbjT (DUF2867 family)
MSRFAVAGVTGGQGGAVAAALVEAGSLVRGITRHTNSPGAQRLARRGVEVVAADMADEAALARAFSDVDGVFALTTPFEDGAAAEVDQGRHLIAAAQRAGVPHLVYSSVASADQHTGIPHFDSKATVEAILRASSLSYTIVGPTYFYDNLLGGMQELRAGRFELPVPVDVPLQQLSRRDLGRFVALVLQQPARFRGARIDLAPDNPTPRGMADILQRAAGHPIGAVYVGTAGITSPDMRAMFEFLTQRGYSADIVGLRRDFPQIGWQQFDEWVRDDDGDFDVRSVR